MGSKWKSNSVELRPYMLDWLCGELLGDGSLQSIASPTAKFRYSSKYVEYIGYVAKTLNSFGIEQSGRIYKHPNEGTVYGPSYSYQSLTYPELWMLYDLWYLKGKKIVPEGLMLPSVTCRQWYIGDGCLQRRQGRRPNIIMCTECFSVTDIDWLVSQLVSLGFNATRQLNSNRIRISSYSVKDFLEYIGECPVECYKYKWNLGGE